MPRLRELLIRLWQTLRPGSGDRDLEEELRLHRELAAEDARRGADSPEQAARASRIQSGAMAPAMEALRDQHTLPWLRDLSQDTRYAIRTLRRAPGFAGVVILTLALGIGANTAIFSVIKTVLLRPLPYPDADRVVWVVENIPATEPGGTVERFAPIELSMLADFRAQTSMLDAVGAHSGTIMTLMGRAEPILLQGSQMSPDMFAILGARAALGRTFLAAEERPGADPVVVLSSVAWRAYFGGDPTILGQSAVLDGTTYTVVGVMGPDFRFPDPRTAFWIPLPVGPTLGRSLRVRPVARLAEGVALSQASAEISTLLYRLRDISPAEDLMMDFTRYEVIPVQDEIAASSRLAVLMLAAATAAVFLIGGINVAHLLVARTLTRRRELAVRASLGASRGRVIRQLLVENVGLAAIGGVAGLGVAHGSLTVVKTIGASLPRRDLSPSLTLPRVEELALDPSALVFGLVLAVLTGIACGLAPALSRSRAQWMRRHLSGVDTRSGLAAIGPHRVRGSLVVAEVALATTLLIAGALLMQSFVMQARVDPGFDADNVVTFQARLPFATTRAESPALAHAMEERLAALPRVHSVGYASRLPMGGGRSGMALKPPESSSYGPVPSSSPRWTSTSSTAVRSVRVRGLKGHKRSSSTRPLFALGTLARVPSDASSTRGVIFPWRSWGLSRMCVSSVSIKNPNRKRTVTRVPVSGSQAWCRTLLSAWIKTRRRSSRASAASSRRSIPERPSTASPR
jgi:predicted permease